MNNFRWGFLAAAGSFIISVGLGLVFGVNASHIIIRAIIFSAVFFGAGFGLCFLVSNFFPELMLVQSQYDKPEKYDQNAGQHVNITLDTTGEYAVPELFKSPDAPDELGNIEDLVSGYFKPRSEEGIDRIKEESYNQEGSYNRGGDYNNTENFPNIPEADSSYFQDIPSFEKPQAEKSAFNPSFGDDSDGLGGLPDLDAMAMAFSPTGGHPPETFSGGGDPFGIAPDDNFEAESSPYVGNKSQPLKGDFNPKEIAEGIRTVLIKDKQ